MKAIRNTTLLICSFIGFFFLVAYCESKKDPYEEGSHWDYSIECENGFVYKSLNQRRGTIQVLNSDGTPLKCGDKIY
jgi:hypothetical protein